METIPPLYWMLIIAIGVGFLCFVLYEFAMLIKESKNAVSDSRKIIQEAEKTIDTANKIMTEATEIVSTVKGTVYEINSAIIRPVRKISSFVSVASAFTEGLTSKRK